MGDWASAARWPTPPSLTPNPNNTNASMPPISLIVSAVVCLVAVAAMVYLPESHLPEPIRPLASSLTSLLPSSTSASPEPVLSGEFDLCEADLRKFDGRDEEKPLLLSVGGFVCECSGSRPPGPFARL